MASVEQQERIRLADELYERYAKPAEAQHPGQYVAIAPDGRTVFASTVKETADKALAELGQGVFLFKVGEKIVYRLR